MESGFASASALLMHIDNAGTRQPSCFKLARQLRDHVPAPRVRGTRERLCESVLHVTTFGCSRVRGCGSGCNISCVTRKTLV